MKSALTIIYVHIFFLYLRHILLIQNSSLTAPDRNPENVTIVGHSPHQMDITWEVTNLTLLLIYYKYTAQ